MKLTKKSEFTGDENTLELDITEEQLNSYYNSGMNVQDAFPHLNADEREFIMTGCTPDEWNNMFSGGPEDNTL